MPAIIDTDIVIAGGGSAGVAAAVAAASKGLRVVLIEQNQFLGGKATAAEVGTICGLYHYSKNEVSRFVVKGFTKTFAEQLQKGSGTIALHNKKNLHYLPYKIDVFKEQCIHLLQQHNVQVLLNAKVVAAKMEGGIIKSISISQDGLLTEINCKSIADCSGESSISLAAGLTVLSNKEYQAAAQIFTLENVPISNESLLGMILIKELKSAIDNKQLEDYFDRVYVVEGSLRNNTVSIKVGLPVPVTNTAENISALKKAANEFVEKLVAFLIQHVPVFKDASLQHIAPEVGIRVGMRSLGKYILTEEDVLSCRKFEDAIANGSWPVEEWVQDKRVHVRFLHEEDFYQIPADCLQSNVADNLFFAGRTISATEGAIASARVMGTCLQTGYAAGALAASRALNISAGEAIKNIQADQL